MKKSLSDKLGYTFANQSLLKMALTHRSSDADHNERLEFLGDSIVNFIVAEALYQKFPQATEGELSRFRASLINRDTLLELARQFDLGQYLHLGPGEVKTGVRESILSCAMEAIIGAIYLESGFAVVRECVLRWYEPLLLPLTVIRKDFKTELQEYLQQLHMSLPRYVVDSVTGQSHQQTFVVSCHIKDVPKSTVGKGTSRRRAEQAAAENMLGKIKK